jgi:hypothetical protein
MISMEPDPTTGLILSPMDFGSNPLLESIL